MDDRKPAYGRTMGKEIVMASSKAKSGKKNTAPKSAASKSPGIKNKSSKTTGKSSSTGKTKPAAVRAIKNIPVEKTPVTHASKRKKTQGTKTVKSGTKTVAKKTAVSRQKTGTVSTTSRKSGKSITAETKISKPKTAKISQGRTKNASAPEKTAVKTETVKAVVNEKKATLPDTAVENIEEEKKIKHEYNGRENGTSHEDKSETKSASKRIFKPFLNILTLIRPPEKAPEKMQEESKSDIEEKDIEPVVNRLTGRNIIAEKQSAKPEKTEIKDEDIKVDIETDSEKVVEKETTVESMPENDPISYRKTASRVTELLKSQETESVSTDEQALAAVAEPAGISSNDSAAKPETVKQTFNHILESSVSEEKQIDKQSENRLRFSLGSESQNTDLLEKEGGPAGSGDETFRPVIVERADIFLESDEIDMLAEITAESQAIDEKAVPDIKIDKPSRNIQVPEQVSEALEETEMTEVSGPEVMEPEAKEKDIDVLSSESDEETMVSSETEEDNDDVNRIVLLRPAEDVRPQMREPDFDITHPKSKRTWSLDVEIALRDLMGDIPDSSRMSFDEMFLAWKRGYESYFRRPLNEYRFPYIWVDTHEISAFPHNEKRAYLSIIGADTRGRKKLLALMEADPSSPEIWRMLLNGLERLDLANPRLFIGHADLPVWEVLPDIFPRAGIQFCWQKFSDDLIQEFPTEIRTEARERMEKIRYAGSRENAQREIDYFKAAFGRKFPYAVTEFLKNCNNLLSYYDYPARHWRYIARSGQVKANYPSQALLQTVFKYERMTDAALYLIFNYLLRFQRDWEKIPGIRALRGVQAGKKYHDGMRVNSRRLKKMASTADRDRVESRFSRMAGKFKALIKVFSGTKKHPAKSGKTPAASGQTGQSANRTVQQKQDRGSGLDDLLKASRQREKGTAFNKAQNDRENTRKNLAELARKKPVRAVSGLEREILESLKQERI